MPLTKEEKCINRNIASKRVLNENVIGRLKRFKILSDKYRNRRKRFGLRFYRMAKRSATECAGVLDVCQRLRLVEENRYTRGRELLIGIVSMLIKMAQKR